MDHTADAKFRARGETLEEAVAWAARAVASLIWDGRRVGEPVVRPVDIRGRTLDQLVVRALDEIVYLLETEGFLLAEVRDPRVDQEPDGSWRLRAAYEGERITAGHGLRSGVKAVTYNELEITRDDGVTIQVVVDV